jgi:hypothetical protein
MGRLKITVTDKAGNRTAARVSVADANGRAYAPRDAWMHADDSFDRHEAPFEAHYFHTAGEDEIEVPIGPVSIDVMKGFEYRTTHQTIDIRENAASKVTIQLQPLDLPRESGSRWVSGDVHVHMNYGGAYRNAPSHLIFQAAAENLPIVQDLVVNKEQRIPDISYFRTTADPASTAGNLLLHGQEFHTSYWGHLGLLHLARNFLIPDYAAYANTAAASLYPTNAAIADLAHEQQGVVGYVHPFDDVPNPERAIANQENIFGPSHAPTEGLGMYMTSELFRRSARRSSHPELLQNLTARSSGGIGAGESFFDQLVQAVDHGQL